jgi:hypothetical protein
MIKLHRVSCYLNKPKQNRLLSSNRFVQQRDLDEKKKKVKTTIVRNLKTIPSLTIFLLPGGSLLLPY